MEYERGAQKGNTKGTTGNKSAVWVIVLKKHFYKLSSIFWLVTFHGDMMEMHLASTYPVYETVMPATLEFSQPMAKKKSERK